MNHVKNMLTRFFNRFRCCSTSAHNQRSKPGSKSQESHQPRWWLGDKVKVLIILGVFSFMLMVTA